MDSKTYISTYLDDLKKVIDSLPMDTIQAIYEKIEECQVNGKTIFLMGNGGSAATASHMMCDFGKNTRGTSKPRLKVIALNDNMPTFSAYANDEGYDRVFAEPLISLAEKGDFALAISGSGNSPNVLEGIKTANEIGLFTIGFTGYGGGKLKDLVDLALVVDVDDMEQIEDVHMIVDHVLTGLLRGGRYGKCA